ncbi:TetR/AcrR family transcriptional regulator [Dactylosporangium sp. NPDC051541]|uniref:TetR/AcrR family transcriptional regulator n=1 Tax=Dactylosporangium sp. NPDC051541 TaxID=3363977 RepID=UPI0037B6CA12
MPARKRTAVNGEQRRVQIVAAAQHAIATLGFEGLRVRDVAEQVGLNIATLHYYFPTKEALVTAVAQQIVGRLDRVPPSGPEREPRTVLAEHLEHILTRFAAERAEFVVLNELYARAGRDPELRATLQANDAAWAGFLYTVFAKGVERGQFRADLDPDAAAVLVIGFLKSLLMQLDLTDERARAAADELLRAVA